MHFIVGGDHAFANRVERNVQALFFFVQRSGEISDFRHVDVGADHAQGAALFVQNDVALATNVAHFSLAGEQPEFQNERPRVFQQRGDLKVGAFAVFRQQQGAPQRQRRCLVRAEVIKLIHAFVPGEGFTLHHPFPNTDATHLIGQCDALHQAVVFRCGAFQLTDVFHLRNKIQRQAFGIAYQRYRQQRPDVFAVAANIAFLQGVAADVAV
ncbi:hypothetical protein D3C79_328320 [compost metagenome]